LRGDARPNPALGAFRKWPETAGPPIGRQPPLLGWHTYRPPWGASGRDFLINQPCPPRLKRAKSHGFSPCPSAPVPCRQKPRSPSAAPADPERRAPLSAEAINTANKSDQLANKGGRAARRAVDRGSGRPDHAHRAGALDLPARTFNMDEPGSAGDRGHHVLGCLAGNAEAIAKVTGRLHHPKRGTVMETDHGSRDVHASRTMAGRPP